VSQLVHVQWHGCVVKQRLLVDVTVSISQLWELLARQAPSTALCCTQCVAAAPCSIRVATAKAAKASLTFTFSASLCNWLRMKVSRCPGGYFKHLRDAIIYPNIQAVPVYSTAVSCHVMVPGKSTLTGTSKKWR
jgi:hypothetical protein